MIDTLMPSDSFADDNGYHRELRAAADEPYQPTGPQPESNPVTILDDTIAIKRMGSCKAPGHDRITAGILKQVLPVIAPELTGLLDECLRTSTFPSRWKRAEVIAIPKGRDKDPTALKSYRPISLLPVLGKVL